VLCEQNNLINAFTMGLDVYSMFAADLYGVPVTKESHPDERFIGKQSILGLGFSMSWGRFQEQLKTFGKYIDDSEAKRIVKFYRSQYPQIQSMWYTLNQVIDEALYRGNVMKLGPVIFQKGRVILPNGMQIHYPEMENTDGDFSYNFRGKRKRLYGGALLENIVQALARIILTNAERRLAERGFFAALSVHDELIFCTETEKAEILERALNATLTAEVAWLPRLPLECESSTGISYGSVK
jgi:DNA polymerase